MKNVRIQVLLAALLLPAVATPAAATSYVPVSDEALVEQAAVVAVVRVHSGSPAAGGGKPATEYRVEVERLLKGALTEAGLVVRVPGGVRADGVGLKIWGAPSFAPRERALLFLSPRADGSWEILHMMLGAFHQIGAEGRLLAVRDLSEARAVAPHGKSGVAETEVARDFDRFGDWIAARARGLAPAADYVVPGAPPPLDREAGSFTFLTLTGLERFRWFEFTAGGSVGWRAHSMGQQGLAGGGYGEFQAALAAWNDDADTNVQYVYDGTTPATGGLQTFDGINTILFNDPEDEVPSYSCLGGGILAQGGPWFDETSTATFRGEAYVPIAGADIVVNDGIACFFASSPSPSLVAAELFAHELGHTLGLGHSCQSPAGCLFPALDDALMNAFIHDDGRGAQLKSDDRAGLFVLHNTLAYDAGSYFTVTPCRLFDSRRPNGANGGPHLTSGAQRFILAAGQCGIPTSAQALALNLTVVNASGAGHVILYPADGDQPSTSSLNFGAGQTRANNAILKLSEDVVRAIAVRPVFQGTGTIDLIVDVNGYFQ